MALQDLASDSYGVGMGAQAATGSRFLPESITDKIEGRTAWEWNLRAAAYCEWRAGSISGRPGTTAYRFNQTRVDYMDAAGLLTDILYSPAAQPDAGRILPALPVLNPAPPTDPRAYAFMAQPRAVTVGQLMAAAPHLTNKNLLLHLGKSKLARMLCEALDAQTQARELPA